MLAKKKRNLRGSWRARGDASTVDVTALGNAWKGMLSFGDICTVME